MSRKRGGRTGPSRSVWNILLLALWTLGATAATAQEDRKTGWFDEAELSLVATDGNSQSETFSLRNTLKGVWQKSDLRITVGGLRASSTALTRTAVGASAADARLVESSTTEVTAERYYLEARYDQRISQRWYWFAMAGWERNEPAGIRNRTAFAGGAGNTWFDGETARFRTDYGLTYTDQQDIVEAPGVDRGFVGLRISSDYWRRLTATTEFGNQLTLDGNLDRSQDVRAQMVNTLSVRMTDGLALKLSHELQFDNAPSLVAVPVVTPEGAPVGENLLVEVDEVDTTVSVALVVSF